MNVMETTTTEERNIQESIAEDNRQIEITGHSPLFDDVEGEKQCTGAVFNLKNISGRNIGKAVFSVNFYNEKGCLLDTIEPVVADFLKDGTRILRVVSPKDSQSDIKSNSVKVQEVILTPEPVATGNDMVVILNHHIQDPDVTARGDKRSIDMAIRNVSDKTFATLVFEAVFYDSVGNIMSTTRHREYELKPNVSRGIHIVPDKLESDMFKTYKVSIMRALTTDIEKVQLRRHEIRSIDGGEEVRGTLKNLSDVKTDAALIATFKDSKGEKIGTKIIPMKDIEPGSSKNFQFTFNAPSGEKVMEYTLNIGDLVE
jgi:hypothetical protein